MSGEGLEICKKGKKILCFHWLFHLFDYISCCQLNLISLQESEESVFVQIEMILSFEQFWMLHPQVSYLNADSDTYIISGKCEIISTDIRCCTRCPSSLLR